MIGTQDLILAALVVIVLFGAKRLPELMGALGKSMKEFKKGVSGDAEEPGQSKPEPSDAAPLEAARTCGSCKAPLQADWSHCPRCGASAPPARADEMIR